MDLFHHIEQQSDNLSQLIERRAAALEQTCLESGIRPHEARLHVMWGGGKDSTLALVLAKAIAQILGCSVQATTMVHPGLSDGTIANINHMVKILELIHEWRLFTRIVPGPTCIDHSWSTMNKLLAEATDCHPRFMCVGCNLGSIVVELSALTESEGHFIVTGNPQRELREFDAWATELKKQFADYVEFPKTLGIPMLDYYRLWWGVYCKLLIELNAIHKPYGSTMATLLERDDYLYRLPSESHSIAAVKTLSVLEDTDDEYRPEKYYGVLKTLGWQLPADIQGGTESDCMMPAAIAALDIRRHGLVKYIGHLDETSRILKPLPEMYDRAISWAHSGRSIIEGERLLSAMGVGDVLNRKASKGTPIAMALVNQLLPVR